MTTRLIGIKELSRNLSRILDESQRSNVHFVVMRHSEPVANITPAKKRKITKKEIALEELAKDIEEAREEVKRGETYSLEEVAAELGISL